MDNNNSFGNGFEPQRPFTEKSTPETQQNDNSQNAQPQNQDGVNAPQTNFEPTPQMETVIPPIHNVAFSAQNPNSNQTETGNDNVQNNYINPNSFNTNGENAPQAQPPQPTHDYSTTQYQNVYANSHFNAQPVTPQQNMNGQYNVPPQQPNAYGVPNQNVPPQQQNVPPQNMPPHNYDGTSPYTQSYGQPQDTGFQPPKPPKKKMSGGLIAIIIVLCVLLSGSLSGLAVYVAMQNNNSNSQKNSISSGQYSFTIPDSTTPQTPTTPQSEHKESDYSDKTKSDFSGLSLGNKPKDSATNDSYTSEYAFNQVSDSVVGVVCYTDDITSVENCSSQGSGIILTTDGYVVTNAHVIGNSKTTYLVQIVMADGTEYTAGIVGYDSRTDIAILKIDNAKNLKPASFGDSEKIELGEDIIAVGNPGGLDYQNSITKGIVSAVNRTLSSTSLVKYIQTDAAINPGNSGGPIVNLYGQVIGIATSKIVSQTYEGMGFAIPSTTVKEIVDDIIKQGYVSGRVKIGITGQNVTATTANQNNVPQGILVQQITSGGPCDGTELKTNDIITEADGKTVKSFADMYEILGEHKAGDKIKIKYYRMSDGSEGTFEITLQEDK